MIINGINAVSVTQQLYEAWNSLSNNFNSLKESIVNSSTQNDPDMLSMQLEYTFKQLDDIKKTIESHKKTKLISTQVKDKAFLTSLNLPPYFINPSNKIITLPTDLVLEFAKEKY